MCHNITLRSRPAQLHSFINWINPERNCPTAHEYRDIAETQAILAEGVLAKTPPISKRKLPKSFPIEHIHLANRVIDIVRTYAKRFTEHSEKCDIEIEIMWGIFTFLPYVIPLMPSQGNKVLDFMESLEPPEHSWRQHEIFEFLIGNFGKLVQTHGPETLGFTITYPNDPHQWIKMISTIFNWDDLNHENPIEIIQPCFPIFLNTISMNHMALLPIYTLRQKKDYLQCVVELWDDIGQLMNLNENKLAKALNRNLPKACKAKKLYKDIHKFIKYEFARKTYSPYILFHKLLNMVPKLIKEYFDISHNKNYGCWYCNRVLDDEKSQESVKKFINISEEKLDLLRESADSYESWLLKKCPYLILEEICDMDLHMPLTIEPIDTNILEFKRQHTPWLKPLSPKVPYVFMPDDPDW